MTAIPWLEKAAAEALPWISTEQMREVDRAMVEDYEIQLIQMMEQAGSLLARLARARFLAEGLHGGGVVVLAGPGSNGGGALVCARRLVAAGARVCVVAGADPGGFAELPRHQLRILAHLGVDVTDAEALPHDAPSLIVDGLIGYGLRGMPRSPAAELIRWAGQSAAPVLALDLPSGLDGTSGAAATPVVRAAATLTLALPKVGLRAGLEAGLVGELYLADIGVPVQLYRNRPLCLAVPDVFAKSEVVRLR